MNQSPSAGTMQAMRGEPPKVAVRVRDVTMDFGGGALAVDRASFDLETGRFLTILGPSGSGKTTLLRMIAGFQKPTSGAITINGRAVDATPPHRRSVGMVFQRLALFPHMTAAENVAFPLKMRRFNPKTIPGRVREFLDLVKLGDYGDRRINELSGGQQQRVAIARALVFEPELLLLDEPLAALDRKLREEMQLEFRRIQHELGVTTINVTHDQREALVVSDDIIVMDGGKIQQHAQPVDLYRRPDNPFVAGFLGVSTFVDGEATSDGLRAGGLTLRGTHATDISEGAPARGAIRAEQIRIDADPQALAGCDTAVPGKIHDVIFEGERLLYVAALDGLPGVEFRIYHHDPDAFDLYDIGAPVMIGWNARDMKIFKSVA
ncbi:ABC transporter ATP-binding protein [Tropicimonas isoalkanivorans]|uniref:Putative spermidine/putrescine transport system ATP-binding protein n=1 Tax=Tropicimonas isoalkanivorans TaxID=441112 RepID=A0A1I1HL88_9RHOB|nr:ABC transporter ATP-binding protein [Tropicimonas isoalkanivorans]SFC22728.1 putative spermidine/putrescine transport system ATP-binding protein [Tropicimonas isoalkanivorans]